jgi:alkylation response protein AidB-like acyl-CoA dehydrogenase
VASMALGAAEAAMDIAIQYAKERIQFGSPLSEKQGYTHKLVVPHMVRLEAAAAYIDEMALEVDRDGEKDIQVEGSIAKLFTTEAANKAADDAMQALGGYGYITEFEVEKIKRDVKITCIYEGTSEIQQNIISTYRWKISRKTKGEFYNRLSSEMATLETTFKNGGASLLGCCARLLNEAINRVHDKRLTRQQYVMFALADLMTHVEVGASLARKAAGLTKGEHPDAEKLRAMSRIFANEVAQLAAKNIPLTLMGTGAFSPEEVATILGHLNYAVLILGYDKLIVEMDTVADILFERET